MRMGRCAPISEPAGAGQHSLSSVGKINCITAKSVQNALTLNAFCFDKSRDNFYDQISALHKSARDSHPDAALYWLTRMLDGAADPRAMQIVPMMRR